MKPIKSLVLTSAIVAGLSSTAFANTLAKVYIAGAPAIRQDANANLAAYVGTFSGSGVTATSGPTAGASDVQSASQNQWLIPNFATGVDLEINASWTGNTAGFESVASGVVTQKFIADGTGSIATPSVLQTNTTAYQPDFALGDTFQNSTPFHGTVTELGPTSTTSFTHTYAAVSVLQLGVEPYKFVASPGATAAGLTNITTAQAQNLYENGVLPLSFFTGNNSDEGTLVYGLTRDGGSGARLVALAETGIGVKSVITTYKPTVTGGTVDSSGNYVNGTITDAYNAVNPYPAGLIPSTGIWDVNAGDTGYAKFGSPSVNVGLLQAITATPPSGALFVTYLNDADGTEATAAGAETLTYNGVTETAANVNEGKYTFWSYQGIDIAPATYSGSSNASTVAHYLNAHWTATFPKANLNVYRNGDGGTIIQNF